VVALTTAATAGGNTLGERNRSSTTGSTARDRDHDGLSDEAEARHHTDPRKRDTDADSLSDGQEVNRYRTNPRKRDTDGDGLSDAEEVRSTRTNPRKRDSDGDGFGDRVELRGGTNPRSARSYLGFPGPSDTGVPPGTTLTPHSGNLTVTTNNAVVTGMEVIGCIDVRATGVTIWKSRAMCITTDQSPTASNPANPPLTIRDSEVNCGPGIGGTGIYYRNIQIIRVDISGCENGVDIWTNIVLKDSYIHDLDQSIEGDPHTDGIQGADGSNSIIEHNTIYAYTPPCAPGNGGSCNGTSAIGINNGGIVPTTNLTIKNNLLAGGAYTLYCPKVKASNYTVTDNQFSTVYSPKVGEFGPATDCASQTQTGNSFHETGLPLTLP
jgi:hypothetical protein